MKQNGELVVLDIQVKNKIKDEDNKVESWFERASVADFLYDIVALFLWNISKKCDFNEK